MASHFATVPCLISFEQQSRFNNNKAGKMLQCQTKANVKTRQKHKFDSNLIFISAEAEASVWIRGGASQGSSSKAQAQAQKLKPQSSTEASIK